MAVQGSSFAFSPWFAGDYVDMASVTPSDSVDLSPPARGLYLSGTTGNVVAITAGGSTVTFAMQQYAILPVQVTRVKATGTTAGALFALY